MSSLTSPPLPRTLVRAGVAVWLAAGVLLAAGAIRNLVAGNNVAPRPPVPVAAPVGRPLPDPALRRYAPEYRMGTGEELVLVLVGASFCLAHRQEGFPQAVEDAKVAVQRQAKAAGAQFRTIGVSLDWSPDEALAFLAAFGEFDEMSVGSNWVNDSAFRYVWNDANGDPVVPQLLVIRRRLDVQPRTIRITDERVVRVVRGAEEILAWVRSGAPV
jgi:hypothetical protein